MEKIALVKENYTPGYSANAVHFMTRRSARTHAGFLLPFLKPGMQLLDCGCGPGTMTLGLAQAVAPGTVVGVDREIGQLAIAESNLKAAGLNAQFHAASVYSIPCPDESFDVVFAHAVFEHLQEPLKALAQFYRVLKPNGLVALRSPDWGGFIYHPGTPLIDKAIAYYRKIQVENGGDVLAGRKLKNLLVESGFVDTKATGSCESYDPVNIITEFLALRIEDSIEKDKAVEKGWINEQEVKEMSSALRTLQHQPGAIFAATWCEVIGRKP